MHATIKFPCVTPEENEAEPVLEDGVTDLATPWTYCGVPCHK